MVLVEPPELLMLTLVEAPTKLWSVVTTTGAVSTIWLLSDTMFWPALKVMIEPLIERIVRY
jgi:hypothetical protein